MRKKLSLSDVAVLKGIAIVSIVLHNFCHLLPGCAKENEYTFSAERTYRFLDLLQHGESVVLNIFSYAGHYGVPVFLFLSGYGLVKKYEQGNGKELGFLSFVWYNVRKLWWLLGLGLCLWICSDLYLHQGHWGHHWYNVLQMVTFTGNLFPETDLLLGPWWYFSLTMQLYVVYRLFLYKRGWVSLTLVVCLCIGALLLAARVHFPLHFDLFNYLRYNFVGWMIPFALGVSMARTGLYYSKSYTVVCLLMLVACWFDETSWLFSPVFVVLAVLPCVEMSGGWRRGFAYMGSLSAYLFVVHPIVRPYFLNMAGAGWSPYLCVALYFVVSLCVAILYRRAVMFLKRMAGMAKTRN